MLAGKIAACPDDFLAFTGAAVGYGHAWASGRFSASVKVSASK
jgi:hypothetical protein